MVRQIVQPRMTFAAPPAPEDGGVRHVRRSVAESCPLFLRVLLAPLVLALAAIAGVLFAILLPVCGIATIAEAVAKGGWAFVRGVVPHSPTRTVTRN
jgi:hypothetical protein